VNKKIKKEFWSGKPHGQQLPRKWEVISMDMREIHFEDINCIGLTHSEVQGQTLVWVAVMDLWIYEQRVSRLPTKILLQFMKTLKIDLLLTELINKITLHR
jgi:hypothetical protein